LFFSNVAHKSDGKSSSSINNPEPDADYADADTSDAKAQSQESPRSNCSAAPDADAFTNGLNEAVYLLF
jgi:hypothetical protein